MNWTITVKPTSADMTEWEWVAIRADGENVRFGGGRATSQEALSDAQQATDEFERGVGLVQQATQVHEYTPAGVTLPVEEPA